MDFQLEAMIPVLGIDDLEEGVRFYTEVLGCKVQWRTQGLAGLVLQGREFMITALEKQGPSLLWLGVDDIMRVYPHLREAGVPCVLEPENMSFAHHMRFEDPFGNVLWFGSESLTE